MAQNNITEGKASNVIVVKKLRNYSNEPSFTRKAEVAKAYLKKHGLFDKLTKKK